MARGAMAYNERMITVDLVAPATLDLDQGLVAESSRKRRRTTENSAGYGGRRGPPPAPLATLKVASSMLRKCSPYFGCPMISETTTWTRSMSAIFAKTTFELEVQADVKVYEDCFARMHSFDRPIPGVAFCIELLKVATHIGFMAVVRMGMKYLATAPWSEEDVALVCEFCRVPSLEPNEPENDLARNREERARCVMLLLNVFLQHAIPIDLKPVPEARRKFAVAFHAVVSGEVCKPVVEFAIYLVKEEAGRLLSEILDTTNVYAGHGLTSLYALHRFVWLFKAVRGSDAEQELAELVVDGQVMRALREGHNMTEPYFGLTAVKKWARMMFRIVEDVMKGRLFLTTTQRVALNQHGRWLLVAKFLTQSKEDIEATVNLFLLTLPETNQQKRSTLFLDYPGGSYAMWLSMSSE